MICDRDGAPLIDVPELERTESLALKAPLSFEVDFDDDREDSPPPREPSVRTRQRDRQREQEREQQRDSDRFRSGERDATRAATPAALTPSQQPMYSSQVSWGPRSSGDSGRFAAREAEPPEAMLSRILGSYRLLEVIGRGGMGTVYRAEHVKLGRDVALKLLRADYAQRRDAVARFFQEARAVNRIRHRNIVDVTDFVELDGGTTFIIMELLEGDSLSKLMRTPGALDAPRAIGILIQICDGLAAAHDVRIVHRDLKPDNVIITCTPDAADLVKLLDFGVAKLLQQQEEDIGLKTAAGSVIGTPAFMSPEQAGGLSVDARSDVYSLGAIMYEMFTGQPVFKARSFGEYVRRHLNDVPISPRETPRGGHVHPRLEQIIMRCLEKSPEKRFQNARALKFELQGVLGSIETMGDGDRTEISANPPAPAHARTMAMLSDVDLDAPTDAASKPTTRLVSGAIGDDDISFSGSIGLPTVSQALPVSQAHDTSSAELGVYGATPEPLAHGTPMPPQAMPVTASPSHPTPFPVPHPQLTPRRFGMDTDMVAGDLPRDPSLPRPSWRVPLIVAGVIVFLVGGSAALFFGARGRQEAAASARRAQAQADSAAAQQASAKADQPATTTAGRMAREPEAEEGGPIVKEITRAPRMIVVRFNAAPGAEVFAYGETTPVCSTPCDHTIDPADGGSPARRDFVLRHIGYVDSVVSVNLRDPPKVVEVSLKKIETSKKVVRDRPVVREPRSAAKERDSVPVVEPVPQKVEPVDDRKKPKSEPRSEPKADTQPDKPATKSATRPPIRRPKKKNVNSGEVSPDDTLNPFRKKNQ